MTAENETELKVLEDKIKDAEENLGESEHREALLAKAEYLTKIGIDSNGIFLFSRSEYAVCIKILKELSHV